MMMSGISLFVTVGILNIYHHTPAKPVPNWLRNVVLIGLARLLCLHDDDVTAQRNSVHPQNEVQVEDLDADPNYQKKMSNHQQAPNSLVPDEIVQYVKGLIEKEKETSRQDQNRAEWIMVGKTIDRLCLVLFLFVILITCVVMFPVISNKGG